MISRAQLEAGVKGTWHDRATLIQFLESIQLDNGTRALTAEEVLLFTKKLWFADYRQKKITDMFTDQGAQVSSEMQQKYEEGYGKYTQSPDKSFSEIMEIVEKRNAGSAVAAAANIALNAETGGLFSAMKHRFMAKRAADAQAAGEALTQGQREREETQRQKSTQLAGQNQERHGPGFMSRVIGKLPDVGEHRFWLWVLFWLTLLAHIWVVWVNDMPNFGPFWLFYLLFAVLMLVFFPWATGSGVEGIRTSLVVSIVMVALYAIPTLLNLPLISSLPTSFTLLARGLALVIPVWPLFIAYLLQGKVWKLSGLLIVLLLLVIIIPPLFTSGAQIFSGNSVRINPKIILTDAWNAVSENWHRAVTSGQNIIDRTTDPGAYYTGQVEKNKKAPLGVTIENFRPQDKAVSNESEVILNGVIKAKSFLGTSLPVQPACLIDRKGAPEGSVDPAVADIVYGSSQAFTCTFPPLASGSYSVVGSATFPFETWSYISYTFVDDERARNIARQGLDINTKLDIPEEPTATFTSGPVQLGMGGSTMPILISATNTQHIQAGSKIGVTLDPVWEAGKLQRVDSIELKVPTPFTIAKDKNGLYKCDRNLSQSPQQDINDNAYTDFLFTNPDYGPLTTYTSVTCTLDVADPDAAARLVAENDKVVRTFVAVAKYKYTVETRAAVQVK